MDDPVFIELQGEDDEPRGDDKIPAARSRFVTAFAGVVAVVSTAIVVSVLVGDGGDRSGRSEPPDSAMPVSLPVSPPVPLRAAECYISAPSAEHLGALLESIGGFQGLVVGTAVGAFDVVTFDPLDHDRLLAARRAGYGVAENQDVNEQWRVSGGGLVQSLWNPSTAHDFAHYNSDGTITMWVHGGGDVGFAPRIAMVVDREGDVVSTSAPAIYADRFAVDNGTIFALTGDPYRFRPRDVGYIDLLADDGDKQTRLGSGDDFAWIDIPMPGLLVAYPPDPTGVTAVWDTQTLERLDEHPLAGRPYQRVAIAGDGASALGVTHDGELEPLDLTTGRTGARFGRADVIEIDRPVVLNDDGTVALTVERSGTVSVWSVGDDTPAATYEASSGLPRWLPTSRSAARVTSSLAPDASRIAVQIAARPGRSLSWQLIDTDIDSWLARAGVTSPLSPTTAPGPC